MRDASGFRILMLAVIVVGGAMVLGEALQTTSSAPRNSFVLGHDNGGVVRETERDAGNNIDGDVAEKTH